MKIFLAGCALFLLANIVAGMWRILRGPADADRMLAAQLFGTSGVTLLLLLSAGTAAKALFDVALVFALLAVVALAAFVRQGQGERR